MRRGVAQIPFPSDQHLSILCSEAIEAFLCIVKGDFRDFIENLTRYGLGKERPRRPPTTGLQEKNYFCALSINSEARPLVNPSVFATPRDFR